MAIIVDGKPCVVVNTPTSKWVFYPFVMACCLIAGLAGIQWADRTYPVDLSKLEERSFVVVDRDNQLLRAFATKQGRWRLPVEVADVDPRFVKMLIAYEDKRFYDHFGVDVFAMVRAASQMVWNGKIVSGGSTLSMQVARLLEGPRKRSFKVKMRQIARAIQIEQRLSKREILNAYLLLAPYGGNLEGVRAASLAYFGKEPKVLNTAEAALLVALPQSPETRRPDRYYKRALLARDRVIKRSINDGTIEKPDGERASEFALARIKRALPSLAAHLSFQARAGQIKERAQLTIDKDIQTNLEALVRDKLRTMDKKQSIAVLVADHQTGDIVAHIPSPDFFDQARLGEVDMISALRSPGSTLKPFIYGLAFEAGIVHPQSLIEDVRQSFSGYRPRNFDLAYQGTVTVSKALQQSLNIPAISLLASVGPDTLLARFRRANVKVKLPKHESVGLSIGLGGLGISLRDLVQLYTMIPRGGKAVRLNDGVNNADENLVIQRSMAKVASWYVQDVLAGVNAPEGGAGSVNIGYKTGTSYGYRDAWSVGFDGKYVIGVWVGRPDGVPVPGITGRSVAAPILFEAFGRISERPHALPKPVDGAMRLQTAQLPKVLQRFVPRGDLVQHSAKLGKSPSIAYPPDGVKVDLGLRNNGEGGEDALPLFLKVEGGVGPFRWLANGKPILAKTLRRKVQWQPDSAGFSSITVLDGVGRSARVRVFVE